MGNGNDLVCIRTGKGIEEVRLLGHIEMVSVISAEKQTLVIVNTCMCPDVTHTQTQNLLIKLFLEVTKLLMW